MEIGKIRKSVQDYITWRKVQNVFKIGKLDDGREIYGVNGNNNTFIGVALVSDIEGIELIV